ncbi:MAG: hypothetical protein IIY60_00815 [Clostridia bacterium]|nr:hypothetical protein [Clostridia bacterium]
MKKIGKTVAQNLWTVILDIVAVNASWYLALLLRFYVNNSMRDVAKDFYLPAFERFAPYYTVLAILVFALFRLYGGMWQFAGINDMNRILAANAVTTAIQVIGTWLIMPPENYPRMPLTYYIIGALLQFIFIAMIRFGYRILMVEKRKVSGRKVSVIPAMIIGAGETARKAIAHMEDTPYRAVMAADEKSAGKTLNGVPVVADYEKGLSSVKAVFIADRKLDPEKRKEIREKCEAEGIEVQDYTGALANLGGRVPVASLLELARGPVTLVAEDGTEKSFTDGEEALKALQEQVEVDEIRDARIYLRKASPAAYAGYEEWAQQHKEDTGEEVSFF